MWPERDKGTDGVLSSPSNEGIRAIEAADKRVRRMLSVWMSARGNDDVPLKRDIDPLRLHDLLPMIWIYRFEPGCGDFVCRLAGEDINNAWGGSIRGRRFRDVVGSQNHEHALKRWKAVISVPHIQYGRVADPILENGHAIAERLVLPLASEPGRIDHTIGLSLYAHKQSDRERIPPVWEDVVTIPCADIPHDFMA